MFKLDFWRKERREPMEILGSYGLHGYMDLFAYSPEFARQFSDLEGSLRQTLNGGLRERDVNKISVMPLIEFVRQGSQNYVFMSAQWVNEGGSPVDQTTFSAKIPMEKTEFDNLFSQMQRGEIPTIDFSRERD